MEERRILRASGDVMAEVLAAAMETMAYVCAGPPEGPSQPPVSPLRVCIDFGLVGGEVLELVANEDFGRLLATNILADPDRDVDSSTALDALRELVNVTCGSLLARLGATASQMGGMSVPSIVPFDTAHWPGLLSRPESAVVNAEGHTVVARLGRAA